MKPTAQISSNHRPLRTEGTVRPQPGSLPLTDYSFQATAQASGTSSCVETQLAELRTFRIISREFFQAEAVHEYATEAVFFAGIACVAAWPIVVVLNQLTGMMI
jgi:hypothetical protein